MTIVTEAWLLIAAGALGLFWIATWASGRRPLIRNLVSFCLAVGSTYAIGLAFDMLVATSYAEIPEPNVVLPITTWTAIAAIASLLARRAAGARMSQSLPFFLNASIAMLAGIERPRNIATGAFLVLVGVIQSVLGDRGEQRASDHRPWMRRAFLVSMPARLLTSLAAGVVAVWAVLLTYRGRGLISVAGLVAVLAVVTRLGASPVLAVAASVICFRFHAVGWWAPAASYLIGAVLLFVDNEVHSKRFDPRIDF